MTLREEAVPGTTGRLYRVSRPGRSIGPDEPVPDGVVRRWVDGIYQRLQADGAVPGDGALHYVCLLGWKRDGRSEICEFYAARGDHDPPSERPPWAEYLNGFAPDAMRILVHPFPTTDHVDLPEKTGTQAAAEIRAWLDRGATVLVGCSMAQGRTGEVLEYLRRGARGDAR